MRLMEGKLGRGGVRLFEFKPHMDDRGLFIGMPIAQRDYYDLPEFVECNVSCSAAGVIRGLHFQTRAFAQAKLVTCLRGSLLDVFVDVRPESPTFGEWGSRLLTGLSGEAIFIPEGFAHGFQALHDNTLLQYHVSKRYEPNYQGGIRWDDPTLDIDWNKAYQPILSSRDRELPTLDDWKRTLA